MWHQHSNVHWNSDRCLPKVKQSSKKQGIIVRNKEESIELLCNIDSLMWQWMLNNLIKNRKEAWGMRNAVRQKNAENNLDLGFEQWGSCKENGKKDSYTYRIRLKNLGHKIMKASFHTNKNYWRQSGHMRKNESI